MTVIKILNGSPIILNVRLAVLVLLACLCTESRTASVNLIEDSPCQTEVGPVTRTLAQQSSSVPLSDVSSTGTSDNKACKEAACKVELLYIPASGSLEGESSSVVESYSLVCRGCRVPLKWNVTDWLAEKLLGSYGTIKGVNLVPQVFNASEFSWMLTFDGQDYMMDKLTLEAEVQGLELLAPGFNISDGAFVVGYSKQKVLSIQRVTNLDIINSVVHGLPLLSASLGLDSDVYNAGMLLIKNSTFGNMDLTAVSHNQDWGDLIMPIVNLSASVCVITVSPNSWLMNFTNITDSTFTNITTRVVMNNSQDAPGNGLRHRIVCVDGSEYVRFSNTVFSDLKDESGHSLDVLEMPQRYTSRWAAQGYELDNCTFSNITAALLGALQVSAFTCVKCAVYDTILQYSGFAFMMQGTQHVLVDLSTFSNIQLGPAAQATDLAQQYYNPGVGVIKTSTLCYLTVTNSTFSNLATYMKNASSSQDTSHFAETAAIAAGADAVIEDCTFINCFVSAAVLAYSGVTEVLGRVYSGGTISRVPRNANVITFVDHCKFGNNIFGLFVDGFQVFVSRSDFHNSTVAGMHVSSASCLVVNGTGFTGAAVVVERASNPGGADTVMCRGGWFPVESESQALLAAAQQAGQGFSFDTVSLSAGAIGNAEQRVAASPLAAPTVTPVSVYFESIRISGVNGGSALSITDVHKASLQRVELVNNFGKGGAVFNSVSGLLLLQCQLVNNSASTAGAAGGASLTAVSNAYVLNSSFEHNIGATAGGVLLQSCGPVTINSCSFVNNSASQSGGAMRVVDTQNITIVSELVHQPETVRCLENDVMYIDAFTEHFGCTNIDWPSKIDFQYGADEDQTVRVCRKAVFGGSSSVFAGNSAGQNGGAVAIEGLTLAAWNATLPRFVRNKAGGDGGAVAIQGDSQQVINWHMVEASLLGNSAAAAGGAISLIIPVQGILCERCNFSSNTAGAWGGAIFSSAASFCSAELHAKPANPGLDLQNGSTATPSGPSTTLRCSVGHNSTFKGNQAMIDGTDVYLADTTANSTLTGIQTFPQLTTPSANAFHQQSNYTQPQQMCSVTNSTRSTSAKAAGPPCKLQLIAPTDDFILYVNNGSGLPTISAVVTDCFCNRVARIPGAGDGIVVRSTASIGSKGSVASSPTARLTYRGVVLREVAVGSDGVALFDGVDFNQEPGDYTLNLELTPFSSSLLSGQVSTPQPLSLRILARPCSTGEQHSADGRCIPCPAGLFGRHDHCHPCPTGANCPGGALLTPVEGFWHSSVLSDVFVPCLQPEACRGSQSQLVALQRQYFDHSLLQSLNFSTTNSSSRNSSSPNSLLVGVSHATTISNTTAPASPAQAHYPDAECSEGYQGRLCARCSAGYGGTRNRRCISCASKPAVALVAAVGILAMFGYLWLVCSSILTDSKVPWGSLKVSDITAAFSLYLQLLFILGLIPVPWPQAVTWLPQAAEAVMATFSASTTALSCDLDNSGAIPSVAGKLIVLQMVLVVAAPAVVLLLMFVSKAANRGLKALCSRLCAHMCGGNQGEAAMPVTLPKDGFDDLESSHDLPAAIMPASAPHQPHEQLPHVASDAFGCLDAPKGKSMPPAPSCKASTSRHMAGCAPAPEGSSLLDPKVAPSAAGPATLSATEAAGNAALAGRDSVAFVVMVPLSCFLVLYPTIVQTTMSMLVCKQLDPAGPAEVYQAQAAHGWWASDVQVACYTGWHAVLVLALGIPCILLLCVGIPVVAAALPVHAWRAGRLHTASFQAKYGFLHWRFKHTCWYYPILQRVWLFALVVAIVFANGDVTLQLFLYQMLMLMALLMQIFVVPQQCTVLAVLDLLVLAAAVLNSFLGGFATSSSQQLVVAGSSFRNAGQGSTPATVTGVLVLVFNVVVVSAILFVGVKLYCDNAKLGSRLQKLWIKIVSFCTVRMPRKLWLR